MGGQLVFASADIVDSFDPELSIASGVTLMVWDHVYGYLTRMADEDRLKVEGDVAESWEYNEDGTQLTFKLRDGVKFHDGSSVTVEDVLFSFETSQAGANWGYALADMTFEAPDDSTVVITMPTPNFELHKVLTSLYVPIIPADFGGKSRDEFFQNPISTGPFAFDSWTPGEDVVLRAFEDYWRGRPNIDELVVKTISDPNAALLAFENGEIQVWQSPPFELLDTLPGTLISQPVVNTPFLFFNSQAETLADVRVRQAIMYAVDRDALREGVTSGHSRPMIGLEAPDPLWPELGPGPTNPITYDPEKAKALLAEAGKADGLTVEIMVPIGFPEYEAAAQILQQQLAQVGIDLQIDLLDIAAFFEKGFSGGHEFGIFGYGFVNPAASESILYVMGSGGVFGGYDTSALFDIWAKYNGTNDPGEHEVLFTAFEDWIVDNGALFGLYGGNLILATQGVSDVNVGVITWPRFTTAVVEG